MDQAVRLWPTPRTEGFDAGSHRGNPDSLHAAVKLWPTVQARDWKGPSGRSLKGEEKDLPSVIPGKLNPEWVARLMGYPDGWLDLGTEETGSPASPA